MELKDDTVSDMLLIEEQQIQLRSKNEQIANLVKDIDIKNNALIEYHRKLMQKNNKILDLKKKSNRFNFLSKIINKNKKDNQEFIVEIVPIKDLCLQSKAWLSIGEDPQFALVTLWHWHKFVGWHLFTIEIYSGTPLSGQIYFNVGNGYNEELKSNITIHGNGLQEIPVLIPKNCINIRFDPCNILTKFTIKLIKLVRIKDIVKLEKEYKLQYRTYELLGAREGNIADLIPINSIKPESEGVYAWKSESDDPYFHLEIASGILKSGWNKIEICISASIQYFTAKIYFDYGDGFTEENMLELPLTQGETTARLFYLKKIPEQIRFDPVECRVSFSVRKINIVNISKNLVEKEIINRLLEFNKNSNKNSTFQIKNKIVREAKKNKKSYSELLLDKYNKTFILKCSNQVRYNDWIVINENLENEEINSFKNFDNIFKLHPCITVIMPVYNTDITYLRKAINSVLNQSYSNWELSIADDFSPNQSVRQVLEEYSNLDQRIKVVYRKTNGHISAASNSALETATGDFVALLDHDDELAKHALYYVVSAINNYPNASIFYSDEDKIDEQGVRTDPHFKPDWNPDQFFSQNYISHLGVYRRELINKIGGFKIGVEGSQDQDLLLRCLPYIKDVQIIHIPKVLYHWRALKGSTALDSTEKSYTTNAGIKALKDYFNALGKKDIIVENGMVPNTYRVRYPIPNPQPLVSLLIPTRDMLSLLKVCVESIINKTTYQNYEIIILDNGSVKNDTLTYFSTIQAKEKRVKVLKYDHPFNYSAINNFGVTHAKGDIIGLINNDVEVISPEWLTEMVSHVIRPEIGCVGAKLYYGDDTIQHAGVIIGLGGVAGHSHKHFPRNAPGYFYKLKIIHNLSAVTAACLLVRKSVFEEVGGLEVEGLKIAFNDVDLCLKVREAGYRNLWTPYAELYHHESKSRGFEDTPEKIARFNNEIEFIKSKWGNKLKNDPCYSPNLTLAREDFSI